jgi:hypothetical protein
MATDWLKTLERVSKRFHRYYQLGRWNDEHRHRVRRQRCVLSFWFAHLHRSRTGQRDRRSTNSTGRLSQKRSVASVHKIQAGGSSQGSATYVPPPTGFARVSDLGGLKCGKATQRRTFYTANDGRRDAAKLFRAQADR